MNYDLEICIPISGKNKYFKRFEDFKQFGLKNIGQNKILVSLLPGTEKIEGWDQGWPEGVTVRQIPSPLNHCAAKVYYYYGNYNVEEIKNVRWFMRLDDDSVTNITAMMDYLNELNEKESFYFTTEMTIGDVLVDIELLRSLGYLHLAKDLSHEVEAGITSQEAMLRILNDPRCCEVINRRANIEKGFTDICLPIIARFAKVFPSYLPLISRDPKVYDFLSGEKFHIHKLAHDIDPNLYDVLNRRKNTQFVGKSLIYGVFGGEINFPERLFSLKLEKDGRIRSNQQMAHEFFWTYEESTLCFYDRNFRLTNIFKDVPDSEMLPYCSGYFQVFCKKTNVLLPPQQVFIKGFEWKLA